MSNFNFSEWSLYPVDEFAFDGMPMDEDLAPTHFLGDISICFQSTFCSGLESAGVLSTGNQPHFYTEELVRQESASLVPLDYSVYLEEPTPPVGILAPLVTDCYASPSPVQPFDGEISTQDAYWKDLKRYMDKHGKVPHFSAFDGETYTSRPVVGRKSKPRVTSTPVRRQITPLPKRAKPVLAHSSSVTVSGSSDTPPSRTPKKRGVSFRQTETLDTSIEEPLAKKVKRQTNNSACATDDLPAFATPSSVGLSITPTSPSLTVISPPSKPCYEPPSTPELTKRANRKRKVDEVKCQGAPKLKKVIRNGEQSPAAAKWEQKDNSCSMKLVKGKMEYRCDLCHRAKKIMITKAYGDMKRHLQSLTHQARGFECTTPGCDKSFTRIDSLKRHLDKCVA